MKKVAPLILFSLGSVALIVILSGFFPKYHGMLTLILFFLLMDAYLWSSVRRSFYALRHAFRIPLVALFWMPLGVLVSLVILGTFYSFLEWNIFFRTGILSLFFITYFSLFIPITFLVLADAERLVRAGIRKIRGVRPFFPRHRRRPILLTGWITGGVAWTVLLLGMVFWVFSFKVHTAYVTMPGLPASFNGYRVVVLSDIHLGSWTCREKLAEAVEKVNELKPDVIFFTGDMFTFATADGEGFQPILGKLKARRGVYCILGNHDYGDYVRWPSTYAWQKNLEQVSTFYGRMGWNLLLNRTMIIREGSDSIAVAGVENWSANKRFQRRGDVKKALAGYETVPCKILLSHDPSHWDSIVSKQYPGIGLTLSGHTHGGQFGIDMENCQWSPISFTYKHWGGLYSIVNPATGLKQYIYVNRGLGTVGYAGRVGMPPEITLIVLSK